MQYDWVKAANVFQVWIFKAMRTIIFDVKRFGFWIESGVEIKNNKRLNFKVGFVWLKRPLGLGFPNFHNAGLASFLKGSSH